ncbi:unnamed protein product [Paramecium sonneborni]|uniref:Protein kinase domain-containing protein n=1 Tax=Paramecium sonneborni TaxID=65129 RepID=A0A8S1QLJ6_9CILI|nr:unnamed protein product [Paramecium sonneborni]
MLGLGKDMILQILRDQVKQEYFQMGYKFIQIVLEEFVELFRQIIERNRSEKVRRLYRREKDWLLIILLCSDAVDEKKKQRQDKFSGCIHRKTCSNNFMKYSEGNQEVWRRQNKERHNSKKVQKFIENKQRVKDLINLNKLGQGQFESVYLYQFKERETFFVLKQLTRTHLQYFEIQKHIQQEKARLEYMNNPVILNFLDSYQHFMSEKSQKLMNI